MPTQSKTLIKSRSTAFERQGGRCYYCNFPMWRGSIEQFAGRHSITLGQARQFQCTAEHLLARQDGGGDGRGNVVAACLVCNQRRHKRKLVPEPEIYRELVQKRLNRGRWHIVRTFNTPGTVDDGAGGRN
ncbi:MAG: restriction endonuclease [Alphaproteobacteria bacterium]|nr:restriction endonuclease [Alphaproteobacteria bacterium]